MPVTTKTGDAGSTRLFGNDLYSKADFIFELIGSIDELNTYLNIITIEGYQVFKSAIPVGGISYMDTIVEVQEILQMMMGQIAEIKSNVGSTKSSFGAFTMMLENYTELIEKYQLYAEKFLEPVGLSKTNQRSPVLAKIDYARALTRKCERNMWAYIEKHYIRDPTDVYRVHDIKLMTQSMGKYLNRLSDYLFTIANVNTVLNFNGVI